MNASAHIFAIYIVPLELIAYVFIHLYTLYIDFNPLVTCNVLIFTYTFYMHHTLRSYVML